MEREISAGIIIFRKEKNKIKFLLLEKPSGLFEFPKGLIEKNEDPKNTALREAKEEAGIKKIKIIDGFKETTKYVYNFRGKKIFKIVIFYLGETKEKQIKVSFEHLKGNWYEFEEAEKLLKFKNYKDLLKKAKKFIEKNL